MYSRLIEIRCVQVIKLMRRDKNNFFAIIKLISELFIGPGPSRVMAPCYALILSDLLFFPPHQQLKHFAPHPQRAKIKMGANLVITCKLVTLPRARF
jgi:hypothetical protein